MPLQFRAAVDDWSAGLRRHRLWTSLAWREVLQRYRRSALGPLWITVSMGAMVGALGLVYGTLFRQDLSEYLPFLAVGLVMWGLFASLVNDGCTAFLSSANYLRQVPLPKSVVVCVMAWRALLMFAHNALIIVVVLLWFGIVPHPSALWAVPLGLLGTLVSGAALAMASGLASARFRDLPQVVASVMQVLFFVTPVMYRGDMLRGHEWIAEANPFHHYLDLVRRPLLGQPAAPEQLGVVVLVTLACVAASFLFFARYRARLAYWL